MLFMDKLMCTGKNTGSFILRKCSVIQYLLAKHVSPTEICHVIDAYTDGILRVQHVRKWCRVWKWWDTSCCSCFNDNFWTIIPIYVTIPHQTSFVQATEASVAGVTSSTVMKWKCLIVNGSECKSPT